MAGEMRAQPLARAIQNRRNCLLILVTELRLLKLPRNLNRQSVFVDKAMKTIPKACLLAVSTLVAGFVAGCSSVTLPPAKGYSVRHGDTHYFAKSVKLHGSWAELETDTGTVWANGVVIKPVE